MLMMTRVCTRNDMHVCILHVRIHTYRTCYELLRNSHAPPLTCMNNTMTLTRESDRILSLAFL